MHDQLNSPIENRVVLNKEFSNYLSACITDYTSIVLEF